MIEHIRCIGTYIRLSSFCPSSCPSFRSLNASFYHLCAYDDYPRELVGDRGLVGRRVASDMGLLRLDCCKVAVGEVVVAVVEMMVDRVSNLACMVAWGYRGCRV